MKTTTDLQGVNLALVKHYQNLFSDRYHAAVFPPMPGYPPDNGVTDMVLPAATQLALHKITQGDNINLCAVLGVIVNRLAHYYIPADYPLGLSYSIIPAGARQWHDFILTSTPDIGNATVAESIVALRSRMIEGLKPGQISFTELQSLLSTLPGTPEMPGIQLSIGSDGQIPATRFGRSVMVSYCMDSHQLRISADSRDYPSLWRQSLLNNLSGLLAEIVTQPGQPLARLPEMCEEERQRVLTFSRGESITYRTDKRLEQTLEAKAAETPDALALVAGDYRWSYQQLNQRANVIAHHLIRHGVEPGEMVVIMLPRGPEMIAAIYGVLKAGAAYVPVDPGYPLSRREYIIRDSDARQVLVTGSADQANSGWLDVTSFIAQPGDQCNPRVSTDSRALAYMIYTSGSTGQPKGVMIEHHSVFNRVEWMQNSFALQPGDVILQKTPVSFDVSVWELFWWSMAGVTVSLLPPGGEKDPAVLLKTIARDQITHLHFVPSMLDGFLNILEAGVDRSQISSLRMVFTSGEALTLHQSSRFFSLVSPVAGARLINLYGPTEATVDVTWYECQAEEKRGSVPIGRPLQNTDILILDANRQPVPIGVAGELCIAGVNLARGYHGRPELTAEKFCTWHGPESQRIYRTGDLVRWLVDGEIEYLGRIDHQVKIRGYRIELGEIENTLQMAPGVKDARVLALTREDGTKYLTAYLLSQPEYNEQQVREALLARLPEFMVPPWLITLEAFPLTPNGKLDRALLPDPLKLTSERSHCVLPQSADEKVLAEIWCQVLSLESVGIHDNFFSLGGDSITSLSVMSRARKQGMVISFQTMFSYPTIASVLPHVEKRTDSAASELLLRPFSLLQPQDIARLPEGLEDAYPMSLLQAGLIFQSELQKGASWYHDIQVYTLSGWFDESAFRQALQRMVQEHPILRTSYHLAGYNEFIQCVHSEMPLPLYVHDWRELDEINQAEQLEAFMEEESHYQFDWTLPGLIRIHIALRSDTRFDYILSFHDSALDGWSINLLHTRLLSYYHDYRQGSATETMFQDNFLRKYVALEQQTRRSEAARDYWQHHLAEFEPMPLPRLRPPEGNVPEIVYYDIDITPDLSDRLRALAVTLNVPVKNVLMAAHLRVLGLISNRHNVVTGYEHSGRPEEEHVDQAIGLFLNSLPFVLTLQPDESWAMLIRRIHQQEADFLPYRRFPMADMKQLLNTTETLFESVFNFTHFHMLKALEQLPDMHDLDVRVRAETEFPLRAEFSQNAYSDQVQLSLHYHRNVFDESHIARMGHYYHAALSAMAEQSEAHYLEVSLLAQEELQWLQQVGQGEIRPTGAKTTPELINQHAIQTPDKVVLQDGRQAISAHDLDTHSAYLAGCLVAAGERQSVVAVALPRGVEWVTAMVSIMRAGNVYMPLDLDSPDARLQELLLEGQVSIVIGDGESLSRLALLAAQSGRDIALIDYQQPGEQISPVAGWPSLSELAYVLFTSGSTGKPKGALLEHAGMLNHMQAKIHDLQMSASDVLAQTAPVTFDISVWQALTGLVVNARTVVYSKQQQLDPHIFCQQLAEDGVTLLEIVPSYFSVLMDYLEQSPRDLGGLRMLIQTGEALKHEQVARWFRLYPDIQLVNAYGPTEASDDITHHLFSQPPADAIVPIGKPVQNMWIHILDERDNPVPFGSSGEICVSGIGVGRGYINTEEKTRLAFDFDHPLAAWSNGRLYRTGDRGRWRADGTLAYEGRKDEQVKIRGMRIETGEIENALMTAPGVHNAAVVLDVRSGGDRLVGFVQGSICIETIMAHIANVLPGFMLPEQIIHCHQIPLNAAGKVDKNQLRLLASCASRPPSPVTELPASEEEQSLAQLWSQVLQIPLDHIDRHSDFFQLGGNSLLAMSCAIRSQGRFSLAEIFALRTLARLAAHQRGDNDKVVHELTTSRHGKAILCFSYAGGNAVNFQPIADALSQDHAIRLFAVEPPGNDISGNGELISLTMLVMRCIDELKATGIRELIVWGHCSGTGGATLFQRMASQRGLEISALVLSGKLLRPSETLQQQIDQTRAMSDREVLDWLRDKTGLAVDEIASDATEGRMAAAYRNDAVGGNQALEQVWQSPPQPGLPVLCLLAEDDPLTLDHAGLVANWQHLSPTLTVDLLPHGGHYFIKSKAPEVARILASRLLLPMPLSLPG